MIFFSSHTSWSILLFVSVVTQSFTSVIWGELGLKSSIHILPNELRQYVQMPQGNLPLLFAGQSIVAVLKVKFTVCAENEAENMAPDMMGQWVAEHTNSSVPEHSKWVNTILACPGRLTAGCSFHITHVSKRQASWCVLTANQKTAFYKAYEHSC